MSLGVTPELRQWLRQQSAAGCSPERLHASMVAAGWALPVAVAALAELEGEMPASDRLVPDIQVPDTQALRSDAIKAQAMPGLDLGQGAKVLHAGDRQVSVLMQMARPQIVLLGELLTAQECQQLIDAARPRMARSLTVASDSGGDEVNDDRTSSGMFFERAETPLVQQLEARLAHLLHWPVERGEGLQVLRYGAGAEYKPHYDYFDPEEPGTARILRRGGQRLATVVIYLQEPARGGATSFPDVGLEVSPRQGQAVFFAYPQAAPSSLTLHGGAPVLEGEKWIATKWLRAGVFN